MKAKVSELLDRYYKIVNDFTENNNNTIPFCAAEPIVSEFTKEPLLSALSDRYIKSGIRSFHPSKEFIGSHYIYPIYELISDVCEFLFAATYADARPLSGMNAALTTMLSLTEPGDNILLLSPDAGGHESFLRKHIKYLSRYQLKRRKVLRKLHED